MPKVLGVEIGASRTRICEVDFKVKNPKVYHTISIKTPEGVVSDGEIHVSEELISGMKNALAANKIHTKQIVFSMNSAKIASREIVIPFVKENKVGDLIRANASDYFPVDLEQYEVGHTILGVMENEKGTKQYKALVLAVPKVMINNYYQLADGIGCTVAAMDYSGNSIYQIVRNQCGNGVQMVVKVDENSTMVTIIENQAIVLQRTVAYGAEDAVFAVMGMEEYGNPDYDAAVTLLREARSMKAETEQSLKYLVNGIVRVMDYYSRNGGAAIDAAYLTGFGGDFAGLSELIAGSVDIRLRSLAEMEGLWLEKYFKEQSYGEYLTCIGAAISPIGFLSRKETGKKSLGLKVGEKDMEKISILVLAGGILVAAVFIISSTISYKIVEKENKQLQSRITELAPAKTIYAEFLQQQYTYEKLTYFNNSTITPNEQLAAFIEEMETKMPASLNVQTFSADLAGVSMSVTVKDKKEAAKLIQQFRSFESVGDVTVSSISDSGAVMNGEPLEEEPKVSFSVTVSYKGGA